MKHLLCTLALLLAAYLVGAQSLPPTPTDSAYHYEHGPYGYRAETALMDSLALLEMMGELTPEQAEQRREQFYRDQEAAHQRAQQEQQRQSMTLPLPPPDATISASNAPFRMLNTVPDAQEYQALVALYNATGGDQWQNSDNWLQGTTIEAIATWHGITVENGDVVSINLRQNKLSGSLPADLADLAALTYLNVGINQLGNPPTELGNLSQLTTLYLDKTGLTSLPASIGNLSSLTFMNLDANALSELPASIQNLTQLTSLSLFTNQLTSLPPQIGSLSSLELLFLFENPLTSLPPEIGQLRQLRGLFPKATQLTTLPAAVTQLTNLEFINVESSRLTRLPDLTVLPKLRGIIFSDNQLTQLADFSEHPNLTNLVIRVEDNRIDLNMIARNLTGPDSFALKNYLYDSQGSATDTVVAETTTLTPYPYVHPQSQFQWEQRGPGSTTWQEVAGATGASYTTGGAEGFFRCRLTNPWVAGPVQYSPVYQVGAGEEVPPGVNTAYRDRINQVFAQVDPTPITTGLLRDYGLEFSDVGQFDGVPADSNATTLAGWRFVYGSLLTMQFNTQADLPDLATVNERISEAGAGTTHALAVLHVPYQQFRADATGRGLTVNGEQLSVGNTSEPYETKSAFAAAPEQAVLEGASHTFVLAGDLLIDRSGRTRERIDVDPGTGIFRTIQPDQPFSVTYSSEGQKLFKVKISYTDGSSVESHSPLYVTSLGTGNPAARFSGTDIDTLDFPLAGFDAPQAHLGAVAGARVTVEYGRAAMGTGTGVDRVLDKPFIVVEGFDAWRIIEPDNPDENFSFEDFIGLAGAGRSPGEINIDIDIDRTGQSINEFLEENGYDLVFIDFGNGTDYIERNAYLVENIIEWVNAQKPAGSDDNVVLGMSMGGLVARFALRDMEMDSVDHQTRLYISHDAPHQGANVPVAAQAAVTHLASTSIGLGVGLGGAGLYYNISFADLNQDLDRAAQLLREPATRQLVQYTVTRGGFRGDLTYDNSLHSSFMETYRSMGLPQDPDIRNVAIASGSECAVGQEFGPYATLLDVNDGNTLNYLVGLTASVLSPFTSLASLYSGGILTTKSRLRLDVELNALPDRQSQPIYQGRIYIRRTVAFTIKINTEITDKSLNSLTSMLPLDSSPGGIFDIDEFGDLPDEVFDIPLEFTTERFNFVPTTSALDIGQDGRAITTTDLNARYSPGTPTDTQFDNYFTNPAANEQHIQFTLDNGRWMLNEMQGMPTTISCLYACGDVTTFPTLSGPEELCGTVTYQVQNAGGLPIQWDVTNNLSIVGSATGTSVQVQPLNTNVSDVGEVSVVVGAPAQSDCALRLEQAVAIDGPTPLVTTSDNRSPSGSNQHTATAELLPGTTPSDYVWYEDVDNQPGAQLGSGLTLSISVPACTTRFYLLEVNGTCGGSRYRGVAFGECPSSSFTLAPNPAEDYTTVRFSPSSSPGTASFGPTAQAMATPTYRVIVYSPQQEKLVDKEVTDNEVRIDTRSLTNGYYPVHVYVGGELVLVEQLIVE